MYLLTVYFINPFCISGLGFGEGHLIFIDTDQHLKTSESHLHIGILKRMIEEEIGEKHILLQF